MRKRIVGSLAGISLFICLASPFLYFLGKISEKDYKWIFLFASLFWFIFATVWASFGKGPRASG
jgi:hypothetical protein